MTVQTRFTNENHAMDYAREQAGKGHKVSVEPAASVGADTVVTVAWVPKGESVDDLRQWLRSMDDGFSDDGQLYERCAQLVEAVGRIHERLDGQEWNADALNEIAGFLVDAGLDIHGVLP